MTHLLTVSHTHRCSNSLSEASDAWLPAQRPSQGKVNKVDALPPTAPPLVGRSIREAQFSPLTPEKQKSVRTATLPFPESDEEETRKENVASAGAYWLEKKPLVCGVTAQHSAERTIAK